VSEAADARSDLAGTRYRWVLDQMRYERGGRYGWQTAAAERLAVSKAFVSKVLSDTNRPISRSVIARACLSLGLPRAFFYDPAFEVSDYPQLCGSAAVPVAVGGERMGVDGTAQGRARELVLKMGKDLGGGHGWKTQAAKQIGMSPAHLSRVLAGQPVSLRLLERIEAAATGNSQPANRAQDLARALAAAAARDDRQAVWRLGLELAAVVMGEVGQ
jgi:transcriptional regulator with XRE-family HTH domain